MKNPLLDQTYGRVVRGGSWAYNAWYVRVSLRYYNAPSYRYSFLSFRLFRTQEK